jgi:hypothetical protein
MIVSNHTLNQITVEIQSEKIKVDKHSSIRFTVDPREVYEVTVSNAGQSWQHKFSEGGAFGDGGTVYFAVTSEGPVQIPLASQ